MYGGLRVITTRGTISRRDLLNSYLGGYSLLDAHIYGWSLQLYCCKFFLFFSFFLSFFLHNKTSQVDRKKEMHLELNLANFLTNSSKIDGHLETTFSRRLSLHRAGYFFDFSFLSFFLCTNMTET